MEERNNKKLKVNSWSRISGISTAISASAAVIAVVASIFIYCDTIKLLKPFEKAIINLDDTSITTKSSETGETEINLFIHLKNYGKGIAKDVKVAIYGAEKDKPETLQKRADSNSANDIYPEVTFRMPLQFGIPLDYNKKDMPSVVLIIRVDYKDKISDKDESQTFWMGYKLGEPEGYHLSIEKKSELDEFYQKLE